MSDEHDNWRTVGQVLDSMVKGATSPPNYGWFKSPDDTEPAHDPWLTAFCPYCGGTIGKDDVRTHNFSVEDKTKLPFSYFYYTHRSCDTAAGEEEKSAAFRYIVGDRCREVAVSGTSNVVALRRKKRPIPLPADACRVISDLGGSVPDAWNVRYSLRRCKDGTRVTLSIPGFVWNLSSYENHYPPSFAEARLWVAQYLGRYGQEAIEAEPNRPRAKRPSGTDRKVLETGGCLESWLMSDTPRLFGEAMVRCKHAGGYCGEDGFCHYENCDMTMNVRDTDPQETPQATPEQVEKTDDSEEGADTIAPVISERIEKHRELLDKLS